VRNLLNSHNLLSIGVQKDYYICMALTYTGIPDFPSKHFYWCTSDHWLFAILPEPLSELTEIFEKMSTFFTGEFDKQILSSTWESQFFDPKPFIGNYILPSKGVTELNRLSWVVDQIEKQCHIVPIHAFKMIPLKEVRRNEAFVSGVDKIDSLSMFCHFRKV
jgi:hypothetical protein